MDSDLYKFQQQNFLNIIAYYNKTKEKAENYYSYMEKYEEYTSKYLNQIKQLYNSFFLSLYNKNLDENLNEKNDLNINGNYLINDDEDDDEEYKEGKSIFDLNINDNKINISNSLSINEINDNKQNIDLDLSPIYKITNIIIKQFKTQINGLKQFLKDLDLSKETFKKLIEKAKTEINQLKLDYLDVKQNFFKEISKYEKSNNELLKCYSDIEKTIIQICIIKNNEEALMKNKNNKNKTKAIDLENEMNSKIIDIKKKEKNFMKIDSNKKKYFMHFNDKSKVCLEKIKNNTLLIIKNLKQNIEKFLSIYSSCFNLNENDLSQKIKSIQEINSELDYENIIKQNLKEINDDVINSSYEKNKPKYYNVKLLTNKNYVNEIFKKLIKIGYNFGTEDYEFTKNDEYYMIKKMNNYSLVNKENYDFDNASKKLSILNWFEIMFNFENKYEENKKEEKISDETLYRYLEEDRDCRLHFLVVLGNKRSNAVINLPKGLFNTLIKIFKLISDKILNENDIDSAKHLMIMSQTYYTQNNGDKIYIFDQIKNHPLYQKEEFWSQYIKDVISEIFKKKELNEKDIGKQLNENDKNKRNNELIFPQLITLSESMSNFGLDKQKITNIITPFFDAYKINENTKDSILNFINSK